MTDNFVANKVAKLPLYFTGFSDLGWCWCKLCCVTVLECIPFFFPSYMAHARGPPVTP